MALVKPNSDGNLFVAIVGCLMERCRIKRKETGHKDETLDKTDSRYSHGILLLLIEMVRAKHSLNASPLHLQTLSSRIALCVFASYRSGRSVRTRPALSYLLPNKGDHRYSSFFLWRLDCRHNLLEPHHVFLVECNFGTRFSKQDETARWHPTAQ